MLTIKQLEALREVVDAGSISGAADRLFTTESALSKRLHELEQSLSVPVFDRSRRSISLSATGRVVLDLARELLAKRDAMLDIAHSPAFEGRVLRLGMTEIVATGWLTQLLAGVRARYPHVDLEPRIGLSDDLVRDLAAGELDIVIAPRYTSVSGFLVEPLFVSSNVWVGAPELVEGVDQPLNAADLSRFPVILQPRSSRPYVSVRLWFEENLTPMPKVVFCNSLAGIKTLALAGFGAAPLPHVFCRDEIAAGQLRVLDVRPQLAERVYCSIRSDGPEAGLSARMHEVIREVLSPLSPSLQMAGRAGAPDARALA